MLTSRSKQVSIVVVSQKERALEIESVFKDIWGDLLEVNTPSDYWEATAESTDKKRIVKGDILIITPTKLLELIEKKALDSTIGVPLLVIDKLNLH